MNCCARCCSGKNYQLGSVGGVILLLDYCVHRFLVELTIRSMLWPHTCSIKAWKIISKINLIVSLNAPHLSHNSTKSLQQILIVLHCFILSWSPVFGGFLCQKAGEVKTAVWVALRMLWLYPHTKRWQWCPWQWWWWLKSVPRGVNLTVKSGLNVLLVVTTETEDLVQTIYSSACQQRASFTGRVAC